MVQHKEELARGRKRSRSRRLADRASRHIHGHTLRRRVVVVVDARQMLLLLLVLLLLLLRTEGTRSCGQRCLPMCVPLTHTHSPCLYLRVCVCPTFKVDGAQLVFLLFLLLLLLLLLLLWFFLSLSPSISLSASVAVCVVVVAAVTTKQNAKKNKTKAHFQERRL